MLVFDLFLNDSMTFKKSSLSLLLSVFLFGAALGITGSEALKARLKSPDEKIVTRVVERADPAVVSVIVSKDLPILEEYYEDVEAFGGFTFIQKKSRQVGSALQSIGGGTAFFINKDGLLITNEHVVSDMNAAYTVVMNDGVVYDAEIIKRDKELDLALLQVNGSGFPIIRMSSSDILAPGQTVIAIGNALGEFQNTVSKGIVSGLGRDVIAQNNQVYFNVIQTDAAINTGNSGGPLLNTRGELIGVNFSIVQGADGVSFAVPVSDVKNFVESYDISLLKKNNPQLRRRNLGQ
jgi:serine protease Do